MSRPAGATQLSGAELDLLLEALRPEITRLRAEALHYRDIYDPPAWAEATTRWRLAGSLLLRLGVERSALPPLSDEERAWEERRLERLSERLPRSTSNSKLHHADVLARRLKAAERRRSGRDG